MANGPGGGGGFGIPAGTLAVRAGVNTEDLRRQMQEEVPKISRRGGQVAGEGFRRDFIRSVSVEQGEESIRRIVGKTIKQLEEQFQTGMAQARLDLERGLLSPDQFRDLAQLNAEEFNKSLLGKLEDLEGEHGDFVTEETRQRVANAMKDTGTEAGRKFGEAAGGDDGARGPMEGFANWIRTGWKALLLSGAVAAGAAMVAAFRRVARRIQALLQRAGRFQNLRRAFENLTTQRGLDPTATLQELRQATRGTATDMELMQRTNEALLADLQLTEEQFGDLVNVSRRMGRAVGKDANESYRRFIQAIVRGRRQILDDLGLVVSFRRAHEEFAGHLGKTTEELTEQEKIQARLNAVLREGNEQVADLGPEVLTAGQRVEQLTTFISNLGDRTAVAVATTPQVRELLNTFGAGAANAADKMDRLEASIGAVIDTALSSDVWRNLAASAVGSITGQPALGSQAFGETFRRNFERRRMEQRIRQATFETDPAALRERQAQLQERLARLRELNRQRDERTAENVRQRNQAWEELFAVQERLAELAQEKPAEEDAGPGLSEEEIEERLDAVEDLVDRFRVLQELGISDHFRDLPKPVDEAVSRIQELETQVANVQRAMEAPGAPAELEGILARLQEELGLAREEARKLLEEPGIFRGEDVREAEEEIESLTDRLRALREVGFASPVDAPTQVLQALDQVGQLEGEIRDVQELLATEGLSESARADAQLLLGILQEQRDEARATATELASLHGVLDNLGVAAEALGDVSGEFLQDLEPAEFVAFRQALQRVAPALRDVQQAQAELEVAQLVGDEERAEEATEKLATEQEALEEILVQVEAALRAAGVEGAELAKIMGVLRGESEGAGESLSNLEDAFETGERIARGVLSVADALGFLSDQAEQALRGVVDLFGGLQAIASGDIVGGVAQAIGGVVGIVGGLFGESDEEKKERQRVAREARELADALDRAKNSAEAMAKVFSAASGSTLAALRSLFQDLGQRQPTGLFDRLSGGVFGDVDFIQRRLDEAGISLQELQEVAGALGIDINDLTAAMQGQEFSAEGLRDELEALQEATKALDMERAVQSFEGQMSLLQQRLELFDVEDPVERLEALRGLLLDFADLPANLADQLRGADLTTTEGRRQVEEIVQRLFQAIASGELAPGRLGDLTLEQFRGLLTDLEGTVDDLSEEEGDGAEGFTVSAGMTRVQGNRMVARLSTIDVRIARSNQFLAGIHEAVAGPIPEELATVRGAPVTASTPEGGGAGTVFNIQQVVGELSVSVEGVPGEPASVAEQVGQLSVDEIDRLLQRLRERRARIQGERG